MKNDLYNLRIKELFLPEYNVVKIILSNGDAYTANLNSDFSKLFCYPQSLESWKDAQINEGAFAIEWASGFDIHFDQIVSISDNQKLTA